MLLDQYGKKRAPQGQGGGYKLVSDDGFGKRVYRDYDAVTGILSQLTRDYDGSIKHQRWQNVEALGTFGKLVQENFKPHSQKKMQQQCIIPALEHQKIMERCGWKPGTSMSDYDQKKFDQIINDSNEAVIKTRPGKISVQYKTWY